MASEPPWSVRAAYRVVGAVDQIVGVAMRAAQTMGERKSGDQEKPPLAGFKKATAAGAKGAKWTVAGVIGLGALLMIGAALFIPHALPAASIQTATAAGRASPIPAPDFVAACDRDVIARRCRAGAYRGLPEIEKAECAGRPPVSPAPTGDTK